MWFIEMLLFSARHFRELRTRRTFQNLRVGSFDSPQILTEAILVKFLMRFCIPESARVRLNFVPQKEFTFVPPEFQFEIDE